jgi:hypothetical protein
LGISSDVSPELSPVQRRTIADLLEAAAGYRFRHELAAELRDRLEDEIRPHLPALGAGSAEPLRLWKERLNELARCEGLFDSSLRQEGRPFEHTEASAAGTLSHRSIELDVAVAEDVPAPLLASRAAEKLRRDRRFGPYWEGLDEVERAELRMRAVRSVEQFRASFPPVREWRRALAPVTELWLEARLGEGAVRVLGKVDLLLNAARAGRSTRVLIDLKGGRWFPDHAEDMRLYALLFTLRTGTPPLRVATFFLSSGEWQPEEVTEELLVHACGRVAAAVRRAARLREGDGPSLRPGPWCVRCPRMEACPAFAAAAARSETAPEEASP